MGRAATRNVPVSTKSDHKIISNQAKSNGEWVNVIADAFFEVLHRFIVPFLLKKQVTCLTVPFHQDTFVTVVEKKVRKEERFFAPLSY